MLQQYIIITLGVATGASLATALWLGIYELRWKAIRKQEQKLHDSMYGMKEAQKKGK